MALYLVSYDISEENQDYADVIDILKTRKAKRVLMSQWIMASRRSAKEIADELVYASQLGDRILVTEITQNTAWSDLRITDTTFEAGIIRYARD
jgi:CRISPR/Cas system-associated endoribonuclease Cas2